MKTNIFKYLVGTAPAFFQEWAEDNDVPYTEQTQGEFVSYVLEKDNVLNCRRSMHPFTKDLQQAFKDNPTFSQITLDVT